MVRQSDLFDLIQSLTKSEKRYFRLQTSLHTKNEGNKYRMLFDLIDSQEHFDEDAVRTAFEEQNPGTRFSDAGRYLHQNILKALHLFHLERSVDSRINMMLHQADILLQKKLYRQFEDVLDKVLDMCERHERPQQAMVALNMQFSFAFTGNSSDPAALGLRIQKDVLRKQKQFEELLEFRKLYIQLFTLNRQIGGIPRSDEEIARYMEVMSHECLQGDPPASSVAARRYYHLIHTFHAKLKQHYRKEVRHMECLQELDAQSNEVHCSALYNLCLACTNARMVEKFTTYRMRLLEVCEKDPNKQEHSWYIQSLWLALNQYLQMGESNKAEAALKEMEEAMNIFQGQVRVGFEYEAAYMGFLIYFTQQRYDLCIKYLNRILEKRRTEMVRKDIYYVSRLALLLVYFELGHFDLLEYLLKSTARFFNSRGFLNQPEALFLSFMRKAVKAMPLHEDYTELREELRKLDADHLERNTLDNYFHFTAWVESKLTGRPFAEHIREQFAREVVLAALEDEK